MIVKKSIISEINRKLIKKIKELIVINYGQNNIEREFIICDEPLYTGKTKNASKILLKLKKKVQFKLIYNQSVEEQPYSIAGEYLIDRGAPCVVVYFSTCCKFDFSLFSELYFNIKGLVYHEIEHHLQRLKIPFREKITRYNDDTLEYVNSPSELEAYLKELYFISSKTNYSLSTLICSTSEIFEEKLRQPFISSMFKYIEKRKDLNISTNE